MNLGIGFFRQNSQVSDNVVWDNIPRVANTVLIQRHWQESQNPGGMDFYGSLAADVKEARRRGLKVYIAFEILSADRTHIELPAGLSGATQSNIALAYMSVVARVARDYTPDLFIISVEANLYDQFDPTGYMNHIFMYQSAYIYAKILSPTTMIAVSLAYVHHGSDACFNQADIDDMKRHLVLINRQDMFAVSIYPNCFLAPAGIPSTLLRDISMLSDLPVFVSETGWMSVAYPLSPTFTFPSSEQRQAEYIQRLFDLARNVAPNKLIGITYIALVDPDQATCRLITDKHPSLGWYCALGIMDQSGNPKAAYSMLQRWRGMLDNKGGP